MALEGEAPEKGWRTGNIFIIGFTAGMIAVCFPRVFTALTYYSSDADLAGVISPKFFGLAAVFSMMLGGAMHFIYGESRESRKNLFFAALGLPALLSGGMNMSADHAAQKDKFQTLAVQNEQLFKQTARDNQLSIDDPGAAVVIEDDAPARPAGGAALPSENGFSLLELVVPSAAAFDDPLSARYVVYFDKAAGKEDLEGARKALEGRGVKDLAVASAGNMYYLVQRKQMAQGDALDEATRLRKELGALKAGGRTLEPNLLRVK